MVDDGTDRNSQADPGFGDFGDTLKHHEKTPKRNSIQNKNEFY